MLTLDCHPDMWVDASDEDFRALLGRTPGFFPVDKPQGMTSRQAVDALKKKLGIRKAGHTGTLDPFATGVLVVAVEKALKVVKYAENWDKEYEGVILLGVQTDTWDITGKVVARKALPEMGRGEVEKALRCFVGEIVQRTPPVSAAKARGKRLYERFRDGETLSPPRQVTVHSIEVTGFELPRAAIKVTCGRGTYVRSIAEELGRKLGTGGVLESLRRTREGPFGLADCIPL